MKGIGVSQGIGIGKVFKLKSNNIVVEKKHIDDIEAEVKKLDDAIEQCKNQILEVYETTLSNIGKKEAEIFSTHQIILEDESVFKEVVEKIQCQGVNAEYALSEVLNKYIDLFKEIEDEYLKERAIDIKDVMNRLIRIMLGISTISLSDLDSGTVLVAEDLTPSDTAQIDKEKINGLVIELGGRTSHAAIITRTMQIPTVVGVSKAMELIDDDVQIICDGSTGEIIINPTPEEIDSYNIKRDKEIEMKKNLEKQKGLPSKTLDDYLVRLEANIGSINDIKYATKNDAEGIGLFRSEFLYMERNKLPSEEEQFETYKEIITKMNGKPVVIRTLDVGGDKDLPYLHIQKELNPFLGYRAIRLCLDKTDIFKTQLRAILRASAFGNVKILFPMISSIHELRGAKKLYEETRKELLEENIKINENIEIGIMIEIPSAAIISDVLAKEVDFFSIGTNDLTQYVLAVDRMNPKINHLYNQYHPALIRLINMVVQNAHKENIKVAMCGEMAGEPTFIPILIGMGLDEFSMSPSSILRARHLIRNLNKKDCEKVLNHVLEFNSEKEIEKYLTDLYVEE